jgi:2-hydroxychromene-2-carboxylate isomerase
MAATNIEAIDWYIDFISPFAFLQAEMLVRAPLQAPLRCKPVLFAGLLEHWGQLGPAEIETKRRFTYRYCIWRAHTLGVQMKFPPAHPFNPLKLLRLAIAAGASFEACLTVFRFVFRDGHSAEDASAWQRLTETLGLPDAQTRVASDEVKQRLRQNGEEAIQRGVFGVPTLSVDNELFWGADATEMCRTYLQDAAIFSSAEMQRLETIPQAARRLPPSHPGKP